ncbi:restriction endonuclease [Marinilactibacillus psychrotolerans]|uniref:restriction endonuclease n=1 Tax=Marinilactibacillus psychrotolerans TaxID=191770 RepID=UPI00388822CC
MFNNIKLLLYSKGKRREYSKETIEEKNQTADVMKQRKEINDLNKHIKYLRKSRNDLLNEISILNKKKLELNDEVISFSKKEKSIKELRDVLLKVENMKQKVEISISKQNLHIDTELSRLMDTFLEKYSPDVLIIPSVMNYLLRVVALEKDKGGLENVFILPIPMEKLYESQSEIYHLYKDKISTFFLLLKNKGFVVEGNKEKFLQILRDKQYNRFYEREKETFFVLFQSAAMNLNLQEVIFLFIKLVGERHMGDIYNVSFLNRYLVDRGFHDEEMDLHELYSKIKKENKNYQSLKMEKDLLEKDENVIFNVSQATADIETMGGYDFEHFIVKVLEALGFRAEVTKASGDQGVDILAQKNYKTYAIQTKRYSTPVGNKAIQEIVSGKQHYNANEGWVITNSTYTKSAIKLAESTDTILWDGYKLKQMLEVVNVLDKL